MFRLSVLILLALLLSAPTASATGTMTRTIGPDEIIPALQAAMAEQNANSNSAIKLNMTSKSLVASQSKADAKIQVTRMDINSQTKTFTADIAIEGDNKQKLTVSGRLAPMISVPVLITQRNAGETINAADIAWQDFEEAYVGNHAITNAEAIIGKTVQRVISANTIIRSGMVASPTLVRKNSLVTITYQNEFMSITNQVKSMQDGALGETVRVINPQTNKIMDAVVSGSDQVLVGPNATSKSLALK